MTLFRTIGLARRPRAPCEKVALAEDPSACLSLVATRPCLDRLRRVSPLLLSTLSVPASSNRPTVLPRLWLAPLMLPRVFFEKSSVDHRVAF